MADLQKYKLFVRVDNHWQCVLDIDAKSHAEAFRQAMVRLQPDHYDKPIRLEQVPADASPAPTQPSY